jgi:hypothetical protein
MEQMNKSTGGCLCGAVRYEVTGEFRAVTYCHCEQCRKTSGHFVAATAVRHQNLELTEDSGLKWYKSSESADRGFCRTCGSSVFWRPSHGRYMGIMAGTLDTPTGLSSRLHIYTDDASDYYEITDGLKQFPGDLEDLWSESEW